MSDDRLNSVHLAFPRREVFRHRRNLLLGECSQIEIRPAPGPRPTHLLPDGDGPKLPGEPPHDPSADQTARLISSPLWGRCPFALVEGDHLHPLYPGIITLGRAGDNDLVRSEMYISRRHCAILVHRGGECVLHDLASLNGTWVNNVRVQPSVALRSGDWIQLPALNLLFLACGPDFREEAGNDSGTIPVS